ncbi:MAG: two-component sensor histidine kinase, partial [Armatimonadetes bacterium]|nr:two-component sensor histidine kinase [Armatimonadota bacterium]
IAPEMRGRVFGMFQRLSKDYEGTGIGLALVQRVVQRHAGQVEVESAPGQGATFYVWLPD